MTKNDLERQRGRRGFAAVSSESRAVNITERPQPPAAVPAAQKSFQYIFFPKYCGGIRRERPRLGGGKLTRGAARGQ